MKKRKSLKKLLSFCLIAGIVSTASTVVIGAIDILKYIDFEKNKMR